jgi:hypothetical protein
MKKLVLYSTILMILLMACKKDPPPPVEVSIKGKWTVENVVIKEFVNGVLGNTDIEPGDGTILDFQDNGHLVSNSGGTITSVVYTLKPNSRIEIDNEMFEIKNLTTSNVTLFISEYFAPNEWQEVFINLKR